jgi:hypothetical protein
MYTHTCIHAHTRTHTHTSLLSQVRTGATDFLEMARKQRLEKLGLVMPVSKADDKQVSEMRFCGHFMHVLWHTTAQNP